MAYYLNRAQLIGNLTRDPEARQTTGGQMVASISIATNRSWTDKAGQKQEQADFHNVVIWGKLAEIANQYLKKGRKVFVEGRMQTRDWTGEDGQKRYRTELVAENLILLDRADGTGGGGASMPSMSAPMGQPAPMSSGSGDTPSEEEVSLDDLPF